MKVLQVGVTIPAVGGAEKHVYELCNRLSRYCDLILLTQSAARSKNFLNGKKIVNVPCLSCNTYLRNFSFSFLGIFYLLKILSSERPNIVHIHFGIFQGILGLVSRLFGKKIIYTVHGFSGWRMSRSFFLRELVKVYLNHSNLIICVSPTIVEDLKKIGVKRKIIYIPNGISKKFFCRKKLKVKKNIVFFGRLHKQKGVEYLILAFKGLCRKIKDFNLIIIGDGPEKENLLRLAGDNKRIIFTGFLEDSKLIKYLHEAYVIVLPSLYEGFPIALLEAMASGRPVITTSIKEIRSVVKEGVIFVRIKRVDEIKDKIYKLIKNPRLASNIGKRGKEIAKNFLWDRIFQIYLDIYRKLVKNR